MAQLLTSIFYNIETGKQSNSSGLSKSVFAVPIVYLKQKDLIINVDFVRANGAAVTDLFTLTDTWGFSADDDFDVGSALQLQSSDGEFNVPGDRSDLDVVNGKISFRIDADTTELTTALAALSDLELTGEIQVFNAAETNPKAVFRFKITARNLVDNASAGPAPVPAASFYTKGETDALLGGKEDLRTRPVLPVDATVGATTDIQTTPAIRKRIVKNYYIETTAITGAAAMPDIEIKTDGGAILVPATTMLVSEGVVGGLMRLKTVHNRILAAAEKTQVRIAVAGTSTTHVLTVYDDGIEVDA